MGTGPKTANDSETQDFGSVSWKESTLLPGLLGRWYLELWVADLSDLGGICPRRGRHRKTELRDGYRLDSDHITCVPKMSINPDVSIMSQEISIVLKTV